MSTEIVVGGADVIITPEPGRAMGGYAARVGAARGVLDDLRCRTVVFGQQQTTLTVVVFDLLYVTERLAGMVREAVARALETDPINVLVAATHTHCGPAVGVTADNEEFYRELAEAAEGCAVTAHRTAVGAELYRVVSSIDGFARNRRDPEDPVEEEVVALVAISATSGDVIASIVNMACHPTVLESETVHYSRDFPGVICDTLEELCGGHALFLQGFSGDVNPVFEDHTPADMRRMGRQIGARLSDAILGLRRSLRGMWTINLSRGRSMPVPATAPERIAAPPRLHAMWRDVEVEAKPMIDPDEARRGLGAARRAIDEAETDGQRNDAAAAEAFWWIEGLIADDPVCLGIDMPPLGTSTLPVQVLTLGEDLHIVALPGEPLSAVGTRLREQLPGELMLAGYANRAASYLPPSEEWAHSGYEVGSTRYVQGTVERLSEVAAGMVRSSLSPGRA